MSNTTWSTPLDLSWSRDSMTAGVSIAYLNIQGTGVSIPGIGPIAQLIANRPAAGRILSRFPIPSASSSSSGFGDLNLYGRWSHPLREGSSFVTTGSIKLGTADEEKGLGSGKTDLGLDFSYQKTFSRCSLALSAGYQVLGDPEGIELENGIRGSVSVSLPTSSGDEWSLAFNFSESTNAGAPNATTLSGGWAKSLESGYLISLYTAVGLSDASPDLSVGISVGFGF